MYCNCLMQSFKTKSKLQKQACQGFTLIELLVTIVVVGLLSAVALPSYLNQASKARSSEPKAALGTVNRSQQAYRLENNTFSSALSNLDTKLSPKFYTYAVGTTSKDDSLSSATPQQTDLKSYAAGVSQGINDQVKFSICESEKIKGEPGYTAAAATAAGATVTPSADCFSGRIIN
jgi:type IV pilus assembly protein PilA